MSAWQVHVSATKAAISCCAAGHLQLALAQLCCCLMCVSEGHATEICLIQLLPSAESFWKMLCYGSLFAGGFYIVVSGG